MRHSHRSIGNMLAFASVLKGANGYGLALWAGDYLRIQRQRDYLCRVLRSLRSASRDLGCYRGVLADLRRSTRENRIAISDLR